MCVTYLGRNFLLIKMANNTSMEHMKSINENVINAVQTEPSLWDPTGSTSVYTTLQIDQHPYAWSYLTVLLTAC